MTGPMKAVQNLVRLLFVFQLGMGIMFWMGKGAEHVGLHMALGLVFVVLAVAFAVMAKAKGAPNTLAWVAIVWGIITVVFGVVQAQLFVGAPHILVQVAHLLLGAGMAYQVERMAKAVKR